MRPLLARLRARPSAAEADPVESFPRERATPSGSPRERGTVAVESAYG